MTVAQTAKIISHSSGRPIAFPDTAAILPPGLAVVVCTYQRADSLKRFFESLTTQDYKPDQLIVVDASPSDDTEQMLRAFPDVESLTGQLLYFRVAEPYRGLPRQRNFALRWVMTDLVAFFDDDVVLLPGCLREMEQVHRSAAERVAGVGAFAQNQSLPPGTLPLWRTRLMLRMMSDFRPGRYHRSGVSTPWVLLAPTEELVEGDWLSGCAMMWKTELAREIGFNEAFQGYALGEDLDFSLRAGRKGKLLVAGKAHVLHLYETNGRPDPFNWGYMAIYNRYDIHRRLLADRTWRDTTWFIYVWTVDTLLLVRHAFSAGRRVEILKRVAGRLKATYDLIRGH